MNKFNWLSLVVAGLVLTSCGKSLPSLENFDQAAWKEDKNACNEKRSGMESALRSQKDKLLALSEMEIVTLLGKPDRNELYKRNQKFYYYFVHPSPDCTNPSTAPLRLSIRFNAMGLAKEVILE